MILMAGLADPVAQGRICRLFTDWVAATQVQSKVARRPPEPRMDKRKRIAAIIRDHLAGEQKSHEEFAFNRKLGKSTDSRSLGRSLTQPLASTSGRSGTTANCAISSPSRGEITENVVVSIEPHPYDEEGTLGRELAAGAAQPRTACAFA
jgi:hypothetical protein